MRIDHCNHSSRLDHYQRTWGKNPPLFATAEFRIAAGGYDTYESELDVRAGNSPARIAGDPPAHHQVNTPYQTTFTATAPDGDVPKFKFVTDSDTHGATIDEVTGVLGWTPATNGSYEYKISATDALGEVVGWDEALRDPAPPQLLNVRPGADAGTPVGRSSLLQP